ncbi:MAG: hypothetical protein KGN32_01490 [Burkholderiales bacterium]|nr:hypothetical protein [Burkholderiales bacterium]
MSDAWRYAPNYSDPEAAKKLLQAVMTAHATINFAQTQVNPEEFGTVPDWKAVQRELREALKAAGHPAGD